MSGDVTLARRIHRAARLEGSFRLRSGEISPTYFDKYQFESEPKLLADIAEAMSALVPEGTEVLCGLELGGVPIATMMSQVTGLPTAFIRKAPKRYGTCRYAEGPPLVDRQILLVEDVVSSGGVVIDAVNMMRADGIEVSRAVCVIDRRPMDSDALSQAGITLDALFTREDIEGA